MGKTEPGRGIEKRTFVQSGPTFLSLAEQLYAPSFIRREGRAQAKVEGQGSFQILGRINRRKP